MHPPFGVLFPPLSLKVGFLLSLLWVFLFRYLFGFWGATTHILLTPWPAVAEAQVWGRIVFVAYSSPFLNGDGPSGLGLVCWPALPGGFSLPTHPAGPVLFSLRFVYSLLGSQFGNLTGFWPNCVQVAQLGGVLHLLPSRPCPSLSLHYVLEVLVQAVFRFLCCTYTYAWL